MKRKMWIGIGIGVLVIFLAGAAFMAGRLLKTPGSTTSGKSPDMVLNVKGGGKGGSGGYTSVKPDIKPAPELPTTAAAVKGAFVRRDGNSLFVGTGRVTMAFQKDTTTGTPSSSVSYDGPVMEVVVGRDTAIYEDATDMSAALTGQQVQQKVKPGSLDSLGSDSMVVVWGEQRGDRVVAQVLMYSSPSIVIKGVQ